MSLENHANLKAFKQHGFSYRSDVSNQAVGTCPFCQADKFFINPETKMWDCKICHESGGFQTFIEAISQRNIKSFKLSPAIALRKERGLRMNTLRSFDMGYNPINKSYTLPTKNMSTGKLLDLRIYKNKKFMSTAKCKVGMFGWDRLNPDADIIWLCEGEWDGMAMWEILLTMGASNEDVLGTPGSGTLKEEWLELFRNKKVRVVYDHDPAGELGAKKAYKKLSMVAKDLRFVHWPDSYKKGYDLRDLYRDNEGNADKTHQTLLSFLRDLPKKVDKEEVEQVETKKGTVQIKYDSEGVKHEDVYSAYRSFLHLPDVSAIDVLYGTIIANKLEGDPLWLFLVAPSGGTKSELLMSLSNAPQITTTTSLTPHSLISGANFGGGDPSLIPLLNNKILVIKDFTTILNMNISAREELFGILRDAYDGKTEKRFGNGVFRSFESKFGIIAGVTPAVELFIDGQTALGERFLRFNIHIGESIEERETYLMRALTNTTKEVQARKELLSTAQKALSYNFNVMPEVTPDIAKKVVALAQWTAQMRGTIARDKFTKEITHKPFTELGTRLAKQFLKLGMGISMFKRKESITNEEYLILRNMATSTVPSRMESLVRAVYTQGEDRTFAVGELSEMVNLPNITAQRVAENLTMLGVMKKIRVNKMKTEWALSENYAILMERALLYE